MYTSQMTSVTRQEAGVLKHSSIYTGLAMDGTEPESGCEAGQSVTSMARISSRGRVQQTQAFFRAQARRQPRPPSTTRTTPARSNTAAGTLMAVSATVRRTMSLRGRKARVTEAQQVQMDV